MPATRAFVTVWFLCGLAPLHAQRSAPQPEQAEPTDYLTFAQGAIPVAIGGTGAALGANYEHAVRLIDGDITGFAITKRAGPPEIDTEFVYELPAPTTFSRFAVPQVLETPSPNVTFTRLVEIHGSATGPGDGHVLLASATLRTHARRGEVTEIPIVRRAAVRWVKVRLVGGIDVRTPQTFVEFSEIVGNGVQEAPPLSRRFGGAWQGTGVRMTLRQDGAVVSGCYDRGGRLSGTVSGAIMRATGVNSSDSTPSAFILAVTGEGEMRGVRSSNRGPFRLISATPAPPGAALPACPEPVRPPVGCGATIYGINFDFDSAELRPEAFPIIEALFHSLQVDPSTSVVIEGHSSSDGSEEYNRSLSQRRAQALVTDLVGRGLAVGRLRAVGMGELYPIAGNNDESGRAINRRVVVKCS